MTRRLTSPILTSPALTVPALAACLLTAVAGCGSNTTSGGSAATSTVATPSGTASASASSSGSANAGAQASGSTSSSALASTSPQAAATQPVDCTKLKCVALTYDDGPSPLTPKLLKAFTDRHATATFFILGNAAKAYPQTVKQAYDEGFEIANHTYDHKALSSLPDAQVTWEVKTTNAILKGITGQEPILMRPPYAARTKRTDKLVGEQGLAPIVWNNSPEDWVAGHDTAAIITKLTLERTSRNSIILMHDIHPWTVAAAPAIIDALQKKGYTLVTVSQLLGKTTPGTLYPKA